MTSEGKKEYEKQLHDTKVRQEGGEGAPVDRAKNPPQSLEDIIMKQVVSQQSLENRGGTHPYTAARGELHCTAGECALKEAAACGGREGQKSILDLLEEWKSTCKS